MPRQTSKNVWVNGKTKLRYWPNHSEFAGGHEMGTAIPLGSFTRTKDGEDTHQSVYNHYEKQGVIDNFLNTGNLD